MTIEYRHLLVPIDFGEPSQRALDTLVHVYEIPAYVYGGMTYATADLFGPIEAAAREQLDGTLGKVQERIPDAKAVLRRGPAAQEILAVVDEVHPDLVVMGTHGRKGVSHLLLGSVAERVVRLSPAPVLTMRAKPG